jgi:DNA-binding NarL/FixJ family response regulator
MGRGEEALAALGEWAELGGVDFLGGIEVLRVLVRAHLGQAAEAREALQGLVAEPHFGFDDENVPSYMLALLLEAAILVGDAELCSVVGERLAPAANLSTAFVAYTCPARHLGVAAALLGEPDKSRKYYHQALEAAAKIRFRPEIALTRLQLFELLFEHYPDERAEALDHLDFAIVELRDMNMQPSLVRALRHRDALSAQPAKAPAYPGGLTEREVEVLRLLWQRKTNREIADELVLSQRTVQRHIANIYAKIDVRNRAEATAFALAEFTTPT